MPDPDRYRLLYGPYRSPRCRVGRFLRCHVRGRVDVCRISDARIPWPVGKIAWARSLVVCGGLAQAVRLESNQAVCHWWGVTPQTVSKWRKALGIGRINAGTLRLKQEIYERVFTPEQRARNVAKFTPERARKIGDALRGKPKPPHEQERLWRAQLGRKASAETRAKMSATHKARGTRPPSLKQSTMLIAEVARSSAMLGKA
jgi:hypothetical protein